MALSQEKKIKTICVRVDEAPEQRVIVATAKSP